MLATEKLAVDGEGNETQFEYDENANRALVVSPRSFPTYFGYDEGGNLVAMKDAWGASYFAFDELNRLTQRVTPRGDAVYYDYDAVSNLTRLQYAKSGYGRQPYGTSPYGIGGAAAAYFGYDGARRMKAALSPGGKAAYYRYDASSNLSKRRLGNGAASYFAYDKADRVTSIRHLKSGGAPIVYFDYGRDVAGRITKIARENGIAVYYTYDGIDRLGAELWRKQSDNSQIYAFWYDYDAANNRGQMRREAGAGVETESAYFWYNNADALTERVVFTPPSTEVATYYYYDLNGALTEMVEGDAATYFAYHANQLIAKILPPSEAATYFGYDGRLNRYAIDKAGTVTYYLWDGLNQLEERNSAGALVARYTHGHSPNYGIGSVVEVERVTATTTYFQYLHMDHRGTVYAVTDANENVQIAYTQDAFGRELASPGGADPNVPNALRYQTNGFTVKIGNIWYLVLRYRIIPLGEAAFPSRDFLPFVNKYLAWSNNPVDQVDRNGLGSASKSRHACETIKFYLERAKAAERVAQAEVDKAEATPDFQKLKEATEVHEATVQWVNGFQDLYERCLKNLEKQRAASAALALKKIALYNAYVTVTPSGGMLGATKPEVKAWAYLAA